MKNPAVLDREITHIHRVMDYSPKHPSVGAKSAWPQGRKLLVRHALWSHIFVEVDAEQKMCYPLSQSVVSPFIGDAWGKCHHPGAAQHFLVPTWIDTWHPEVVQWLPDIIIVSSPHSQFASGLLFLTILSWVRAKPWSSTSSGSGGIPIINQSMSPEVNCLTCKLCGASHCYTFTCGGWGKEPHTLICAELYAKSQPIKRKLNYKLSSPMIHN